MTEYPRVQELLEELLDADGTPEDICRACPELLSQVRAGCSDSAALKPTLARRSRNRLADRPRRLCEAVLLAHEVCYSHNVFD